MSRFTSFSDVIQYYPQRVIVLVDALLNLTFFFMGVEAGAQLAINTMALALLVFFYGEEQSVSWRHHNEELVRRNLGLISREADHIADHAAQAHQDEDGEVSVPFFVLILWLVFGVLNVVILLALAILRQS